MRNIEAERKAIKIGEEKLEEIRDFGKGRLSEYYTDRALERVRDVDNNIATKGYFKYPIETLPSEEHTETYWIAEGIKRLGDLGSMILGNLSLKNGDIQDEIVNRLRQYDGFGTLRIDDMCRLGKKRVSAFPKTLIDQMFDYYGDYFANLYFGIISYEETKDLLRTFEQSTHQLELLGFVRKDIRFDGIIPNNGPDQYDLLLLNELYVDIDRAIEHPKSTLKIIRSNLYNEMIGVQWTGYMDLFEDCIPHELKMMGINKDFERLGDEYSVSKGEFKTFNGTGYGPVDFFRKYLYGYNGRMLGDVQFFVNAIQRENSSEDDAIWNHALQAMAAIKPVVDDIEINESNGETICSLPSDKDYREVINKALADWKQVERLERTIGVSLPSEQTNPIRFADDTSYEDAVGITLAMFFYQSRGTVGEWYDEDNNRVIIEPERFIDRDQSVEPHYLNVTKETLLREAQAKPSNSQIKDLKNPATEQKEG